MHKFIPSKPRPTLIPAAPRSIFVDEAADSMLEAAVKIVVDSKTQYPSACNAVETLLVSDKVASGESAPARRFVCSQNHKACCRAPFPRHPSLQSSCHEKNDLFFRSI